MSSSFPMSISLEADNPYAHAVAKACSSLSFLLGWFYCGNIIISIRSSFQAGMLQPPNSQVSTFVLRIDPHR
jgi:hypothetical protein